MTKLNQDQQRPERDQVQQQPNGIKAYCRCWQSKNFPYCDGSHRQYNAEHGDHLGPIVVTATNESA